MYLGTSISLGLHLVGDICEGTFEGASVGSNSITFHPGNVLSGSFVADTQTAGSTSLLLQIALPCLIYAPAESSMVLKGGTNCEMAPQIDYMIQVHKTIYNPVPCGRVQYNLNNTILCSMYHIIFYSFYHAIPYQ
jgi:RNA 3'-terminal phosphate cyclase